MCTVTFKMFETILRGFMSMATVIPTKIPKTARKIGTHNGIFHCDEVLACFMLKQLEPFEDAEIIRTRDPAVLGTCDIVVDVGGVYDPQNNKYDHHQRGFEQTLSMICPDLIKNKTIKLSSAGLIYAQYGIKILREILSKVNKEFTPEDIEVIYRAVYEGFVEEIDAIDNGVPMFAEGTPRYRVTTGLSSRVAHLNPSWNSGRNVNVEELFNKAMELVGQEFVECVLRVSSVWYPARQLVKQAILDRQQVHPSGSVVDLKRGCPWKEHLLQIEKELGIQDEIKFVIFPDTEGQWRVQAIPIYPDSFITRVPLHKDWQGQRDALLSEISGIPECTFCHATGFIGGNKTRDGVLQMALKTLDII